MPSSRPPDPAGPPRCLRCGEVIGVYERFVRTAGGVSVITSRAVEPDVREKPGQQLYHVGCYRLASGEAA